MAFFGPPSLLATSGKGFDKRQPQDISLVSPLFLENLVVRHRPVDQLGGSWECQSVSQAGERQGMADPHFKFFYDLMLCARQVGREFH